MLLATTLASPAAAQLAGQISIQNDYRLRGYSISGQQPAAILDLSYDHSSGLYFNGSAIGATRPHDDPALLGAIANVGYARRLGSQISIDTGVSRTQYFQYVGNTNGDAHYTEYYVGVLAHGLSTRLSYAPDYFAHGSSTLYGEINGALKPIGSWHLTGHIGLLGYLASPAGRPPRSTQYDWQIGLSRKIGRFDIHAALSGGGPRPDYYYDRAHNKTALVGGISWVF